MVDPVSFTNSQNVGSCHDCKSDRNHMAQWCFLECEVVPQKAIFGRLLLGISVGRSIPQERGTFAPGELLLCKTGTVPVSGLVLNAAAVSLLDYKSNHLIIKAH